MVNGMMTQWVKALTSEPDNLSLILQAHKVEGENQLLHTHIHARTTFLRRTMVVANSCMREEVCFLWCWRWRSGLCACKGCIPSHEWEVFV